MNNAAVTTIGMFGDRQPAVGHEILTVQEVARFLRVPASTVYKLARAGKMPASKIGKHWRFIRRDLDAWVHRAVEVR